MMSVDPTYFLLLISQRLVKSEPFLSALSGLATTSGSATLVGVSDIDVINWRQWSGLATMPKKWLSPNPTHCLQTRALSRNPVIVTKPYKAERRISDVKYSSDICYVVNLTNVRTGSDTRHETRTKKNHPFHAILRDTEPTIALHSNWPHSSKK